MQDFYDYLISIGENALNQYLEDHGSTKPPVLAAATTLASTSGNHEHSSHTIADVTDSPPQQSSSSFTRQFFLNSNLEMNKSKIRGAESIGPSPSTSKKRPLLDRLSSDSANLQLSSLALALDRNSSQYPEESQAHSSKSMLLSMKPSITPNRNSLQGTSSNSGASRAHNPPESSSSSSVEPKIPRPSTSSPKREHQITLRLVKSNTLPEIGCGNGKTFQTESSCGCSNGAELPGPHCSSISASLPVFKNEEAHYTAFINTSSKTPEVWHSAFKLNA